MAIAPDVTFNIKPRKPHVTAILILSIVLLLSLIGNLWQFRLVRNNELEGQLQNIALLNENAVHADRAARDQVRIDSLEAKGIRDSVSWKSRETALKMRNTTISKNLAILRFPVQPMIDTVEALGDFVATYDSLNAAKDSLIYEMGLRHSAQVIDLNQIITLQGQQIVSNMAIGENWRQMAEVAQKETRKEKRKKKFFRTLSVIGAGAVGVLLLVK